MPNLTRKYKLQIVGDKEEVNRVYKYLKDGIKAQNLAMNEYMSAKYSAKLADASDNELKELASLFQRISNSKKGSGYTSDIVFAKGMGTPPLAERKVDEDFTKSIKDGLLYGKVSLPSYTLTNPLLIHVKYLRLRKTNPYVDYGIYSEYDDDRSLIYALESEMSPKVYIKFCNGITFRIIFGKPWKGREQREVFKKIFSEEYSIGGSSIQIDKNNKIILNLCLDIPSQKHELDENTVVGMDTGLAIPAMCALNNDEYTRLAIGNIDDFLRIRTQMQAERRRLQSQLKVTKGGHGRARKLKALNRLKKREEKFAETYNHMISRRVVDFALKHNAKYINIEDLSGFGKDKNGNSKEGKEQFVLRNWSYFDLQKYITYKAAMHGIIVRKVNPAYTSQTCSYCGTRGIRKEQKKFICINPDCKCHSFKNDYINADFNAARNIAMSVDFVEDSEESEEAVV